MAFNPYATENVSGETFVPEYSMPRTGDYTAPSLESGDAYTDEFGWSPTVKGPSAVDYPSAQRMGAMRRYDARPDPTQPNKENFRVLDTDDKVRHSVEDQDANGWYSPSGVAPGEQRWAPNPRSKAPAESRITSRLAPRSYSFTRPFDQHSERQFNGTHFSMADHRREYEVTGTAPVRTFRNTFRMEPTPWDTDIVDLPPNVDSGIPEGRIRSVEVPGTTRNWRL